MIHWADIKYYAQVNHMDNDIKIQKKTLFMFLGLVTAMVIAGVLVFGELGNAQSAGTQQTTQLNNGNTAAYTQVGNGNSVPAPTAQTQDVYLTLSGGSYDKDQITVKKGVPVRLHFTAINAGCGSQLVIYGLGVSVVSRNKEATVEFTPQQEGTYEYNCGMRMFRGGKFIVTA